ncbi:rhomboid-domain-containing protein [Thozetella sp. PMI_491]|nr:rhomboid-domain-containing protein [Thozetella sp. PMI_491]
MLRAALRSHARAWGPRPRAGFGRTAPTRPFSSYPEHNYFAVPRVRILRPVLWSVTIVSALYVGCAAYEVYQDARAARAQREKHLLYFGGSGQGPLTYQEIEYARAAAFNVDAEAQRRARAHSPYDLWNRLSPTQAGRFFLATAGLNSGVFLLSYAPAITHRLVHIPILGHNYTLLTSMFAHAGFLHFAANMYGLLTFGPTIAQSRTFERSGSHLAAFYLSSGVLASLAHHIAAAVIPAQAAAAFSPALGASGAVFALVAAFAFQFPDAKVGILFLPFDFQAQQALAGFALFDLYGTLFGFSAIRFAHAAHLGGMAVGSAYVAWQGNKRIWKPTRRFAFEAMQRMRLI